MSGKNCLGSFKNFKNCPKMIFNGFWRSANRIYMCVTYEQVLKTYIYKTWINFCVNRIFDMNVYFSIIASFKSDMQQTKPHSENQ
jgi:hypothetical protein